MTEDDKRLKAAVDSGDYRKMAEVLSRDTVELLRAIVANHDARGGSHDELKRRER